MTRITLRVIRSKPMGKRQEERFDELMDRYGGLRGFNQREDGSDTETEIAAYDKDVDTVASEFRACGFVVSRT